MVEFAFIILLLMTIMLGIIEFSRALYTYHHLSNVARDATRWVLVNGANCNGDTSCNGVYGMNNGPASATDVQTYVKNHTPQGIDTTQLTVTACGTQGGSMCAESPSSLCTATVNNQGCTVKVTVSYPFTFILPIFSSNPINMSSSSEMVISH